MKRKHDDDAAAIGFDGVRRVAARLSPNAHTGTLAWIDARCVAAGMHPLDEWWGYAFADYYATSKMVFAARVGLRGGKSVSVCRALVNDALFTMRDIDPSTVGVVPIISANRTEATDRFVAIRAILAACGVRDGKVEEEDPKSGGIGGEFTYSTLPSGGGVIRTRDSQGHAVEFRVYPASLRSAIGFTAIGGFCDEVDLWQDRETGANPADRVLELLFQRFTTQRSARLYVVSAPYSASSAHSRLIDLGDTELQYIARLGALGAARDDASRAELVATGKADPRLIARADPQSPDVPAWVTSPLATIGRCFSLSKGNMDALFREYGGRPARDAGETGAAAQLDGLADAVRRVQAVGRAERGEPTLYGRPDPLAACLGVTRPERSPSSLVPLRHRKVL